jgi:hypothetical protein
LISSRTEEGFQNPTRYGDGAFWNATRLQMLSDEQVIGDRHRIPLFCTLERSNSIQVHILLSNMHTKIHEIFARPRGRLGPRHPAAIAAALLACVTFTTRPETANRRGDADIFMMVVCGLDEKSS